MKKKIKTDTEKIEVFIFPNYAPEIYSDMKGRFFSIKGQTPLSFYNNNGCKSVLFNGKKYGMKKLRNDAVKSIIKIQRIPF